MVEESEELESRLPKKGDRLFAESTWKLDAPVVRDPGERWYRLPMGFRRAGDVLVEQAMRSVIDRRNLVYAALFCYRQCIELYLKSLINEFGDGAKKKHGLAELWGQFDQVVRVRGMEGQTGIEEAEALVMEMHWADERSDGFRYPTDRKDGAFEFGDVGIDLENLREVMSGLGNFFECAALAVRHAEGD